MKTIYVPKGETVSYESVVTENLVVNGCLNAAYGVKARHICGSGVIHAGTIAADTIRADELECAAVTCEKLVAKRVSASEVFASDSAAVSCFLSAAYVETGRLTVSISEISEVKADEVVNLNHKKRGMLRFLIASAVKAWWLSLSAPADYETYPADAVQDTKADEPENKNETAIREEIARNVREILAEKSAAGAETATSASDSEPGDFELQRIVGLFKLCRDSGYTLRLIPGTPEENAPVFDFDTGHIVSPAA